MSAPKRSFPIFEANGGKKPIQVKKRKVDEPLKVFSWNVAGLRACVKKKCAEVLSASNADIIFLQETKCEEFPQEITDLPYPHKYLVPSKVKKGHAGVAMLSREKPLKISFGFGEKKFDDMGRWIHAEFGAFHVIGTYVINSGERLQNLESRHDWESHVLKKLQALDKEKPVIYTGDLNVAHEEIGKEDFTTLLKAGFVDVYRKLHPEEKDCYTYWTYFHNARARNNGWRIDYFLTSERIFENVVEFKRRPEIYGSDHCPIELVIKV